VITTERILLYQSLVSDDFLRRLSGYRSGRHSANGVALPSAAAAKTVANFIEKASRLYEQERRAVSAAASPFEMYVRRWVQWTNGGLMIPRAVPVNDEPPVAHGGGSGADWQIPLIKTSCPN